MILSIVSTKSGVGKTTLTANLAGYLSSIGQSVLMIDADPQPSLSSYFQIQELSNIGLTEISSSSNLVNAIVVVISLVDNSLLTFTPQKAVVALCKLCILQALVVD